LHTSCRSQNCCSSKMQRTLSTLAKGIQLLCLFFYKLHWKRGLVSAKKYFEKVKKLKKRTMSVLRTKNLSPKRTGITSVKLLNYFIPVLLFYRSSVSSVWRKCDIGAFRGRVYRRKNGHGFFFFFSLVLYFLF